MSQQQQQQHPQQAQEDNLDGVWLDKYSTISRVYNYGFVSGSIEKGKELYNSLKDSNSYIKSSLEYGETSVSKVGAYVGKPILDTLEKYDEYVKKVDEYGNSGLDLVEKKVQSIKETGESIMVKIDTTTDGIIDVSSNYAPSPVKTLACYASEKIDTLVEKILPPTKEENLDDLSDEEKFKLEKRMQFLLKLRKRLNTESILHIPSNSIGMITGYGSQSISSYVNKMNEISTGIQNLTINSKFSAKFIDQMYMSFDQIVAHLGTVALWIKNINVSETLISLGELTKMVKESKDRIISMTDSQEKMNKLKEDSQQIFKTFIDLLNTVMENGKDKLESYKDAVPDQRYFISTFNSLDNLLGKTITALHSYSKNLESSSSSSSPSSSNANSTN